MNKLRSCLGCLVSGLIGLFVLVGVPMLFADVLPLGPLPELIDKYAIQPAIWIIPSGPVESDTDTADITAPETSSTQALLITDTSTAIPTPTSSNAPSQGRLEQVDCRDCQWDYEPAISAVKWLSGPSVTADGVLTLTAQLNKGTRLILPGRSGGASNIALTDGGARLYGTVVPPARGGWNWNPEPGLWIARFYEYDGTTLNVLAKIDRVAAGHRGLKLCLWTGGASAELLDCVKVEQP